MIDLERALQELSRAGVEFAERSSPALEFAEASGARGVGSSRVSWLAKACVSDGLNGGGPLVSTPLPRNWSMKFRSARRSSMLSRV